jgi:hypothetical protein
MYNLCLPTKDAMGAGGPGAGQSAAQPGPGAAADGLRQQPTQQELLLREEAGVGPAASPPLADVSGAVLIADGLVLQEGSQTGDEYRLAMGVYDRKGKAIVRLIASDWQHWARKSGGGGSGSGSGNAPTGDAALQLLQTTLKRTANKADLFKSLSEGDAIDARGLIEVQVRSNMGPQVGALLNSCIRISIYLLFLSV